MGRDTRNYSPGRMRLSTGQKKPDGMALLYRPRKNKSFTCSKELMFCFAVYAKGTLAHFAEWLEENE
jgi:hypothetical protein